MGEKGETRKGTQTRERVSILPREDKWRGYDERTSNELLLLLLDGPFVTSR